MVALYLVDCSELLQTDELNRALTLLSAERRRRIGSLQHPEKRAQCAAAGLLLTHLFGSNGAPPTLLHGSWGKPYLAGSTDLFFNLSHCGHYVICAVSDEEVGTDIQVVTPCRPHVLERCFTSREQAWIQEESTNERFTQLWTMKEAYLKFTGFGLVLPASSFLLPLPPRDGWDDTNHCRWNFITLPDGDNTAYISVCGKQDEPLSLVRSLSIQEVKSLPL